MRRAIARQAEAERERRAKVIHAEGEAQAAAKLAEAANVISVNPAALQLRFLQTLTEGRNREELDNDLSGADRPSQTLSRKEMNSLGFWFRIAR